MTILLFQWVRIQISQTTNTSPSYVIFSTAAPSLVMCGPVGNLVGWYSGKCLFLFIDYPNYYRGIHPWAVPRGGINGLDYKWGRMFSCYPHFTALCWIIDPPHIQTKLLDAVQSAFQCSEVRDCSAKAADPWALLASQLPAVCLWWIPLLRLCTSLTDQDPSTPAPQFSLEGLSFLKRPREEDSSNSGMNGITVTLLIFLEYSSCFLFFFVLFLSFFIRFAGGLSWYNRN